MFEKLLSLLDSDMVLVCLYFKVQLKTFVGVIQGSNESKK